jgi:hypothetical protein
VLPPLHHPRGTSPPFSWLQNQFFLQSNPS